MDDTGQSEAEKIFRWHLGGLALIMIVCVLFQSAPELLGIWLCSDVYKTLRMAY